MREIEATIRRLDVQQKSASERLVPVFQTENVRSWPNSKHEIESPPKNKRPPKRRSVHARLKYAQINGERCNSVTNKQLRNSTSAMTMHSSGRGARILLRATLST